MLTIKTLVSALALSAAFAAPALALEYPIGVPQQRAGMEIAAVYLQPVEMEPEGHMRKAAESDIHLEADIHALANNPNGFEEGAWMPYLMAAISRWPVISCRWSPTTARTMATTSSWPAPASTR